MPTAGIIYILDDFDVMDYFRDLGNRFIKSITQVCVKAEKVIEIHLQPRL
jgi:hypothetical protein